MRMKHTHMNRTVMDGLEAAINDGGKNISFEQFLGSGVHVRARVMMKITRQVTETKLSDS